MVLFFKKELLPSRLPGALYALGAATLLRLLAAAIIPLSADEAYYRVWAHALAPGYLDHPPMVALWIRAGTALFGDTAFGIRLLGPLSALAGSLLLAGAGRDLALASRAEPDAAARIGRVAAWLLNGTLLCNAGAVIMTPDTPLLLFWTGCLAAVARAVRTGDSSWWLAAGLAAGLALDSKYTAFLLAPSLLLWMGVLPSCRHFLARWQVYAGAALALLSFAPVLAWNAAHHWASFARQGGRGADVNFAAAGRYVGELLGGQLGLATPLLFAVFACGVWRCAKPGVLAHPARGLLAAVTLLPALVLLQHALGDRVQANWPSVLYPGAALAAALTAVPFWRPAVALGAAMSAGLILQAASAPLTLPRRLDFTLIRLAGWDDLARAADQARVVHGAGFVAADEYGLASELAYHLSAPVLGVAPRWAYFALPAAASMAAPGGTGIPAAPGGTGIPAAPGGTGIPAAPGGAGIPAASGGTGIPAASGGTGILVRSDREAGPPNPAIWPGAVPAGTAERARHGVVAERYHLYRVALPCGAPAVRLPAGGPHPG